MAQAIIDTDTHVVEPADLWTSRLPKAWGNDVMHVRWNEQMSSEFWFLGDRPVAPAWLGAMFGWEEALSAPPLLADAHPATYDVGARVDAMDDGGVSVAALYPNIAGLAFDPFVDHPILEISVAHAKAYNDFVLDWIAPARERFIPLAVVPYWDVPSAVAEIERAADLGHRGIITTGAPQAHGQPYLGDHHWDPMWRACEEAQLSVSFHAANGDLSDHMAPERVKVDGPSITKARLTTATFFDNGHQVNDLIMCGVLARFPELKFISVESGLGWIPFLLESADYHFKVGRVDKSRPEFGDLLPSDLFHRQVYVNYWFEKLQPWHVEAIGEDNILFETDFPHPTCLYGDEVQAALRNGLESQPSRVRDKILWQNAVRLFHIPIPDVPASSVQP